jgi:protocatechuate 3,4-dioxygenase beta subunit
MNENKKSAVVASSAFLPLSSSPDAHSAETKISRRATLYMLGLGVAAVACSSESSSSSNGTGGSAGSAGGAATGGAGGETAACGLENGWATGGTSCMTDVANYPNPFTAAASSCPTKPDVTIGPCHTTSVERVDISNGLLGIPMRMALRIVDDSCNPVSGAIVEVWHTNYKGGYSGDINQMCTLEEADKQEDFFRGYQVTNADGIVYFNSCFPGWYNGRAVHVHVRVLTTAYDGSDNAPSAAITQLLWDDTFVDTIFTNVSLYSEFGVPNTHLSNDNVVSGVSDKQAFIFETAQMSDGTMLCSKTIVVTA